MRYLLLLLLLLPVSKAAIYLGTCEGWVFDQAGNPVAGAEVNVTVLNCQEGCFQQTRTDSGGYYVVANLNLPAGGEVRVDARKDGAIGSNTGTADSYQAAEVNVSICQAPPKPQLQPVQDTHNGSLIVLNWTSEQAAELYDVLRVQQVEYINVSPSWLLHDLDFGSYTWAVKTCNGSCCSPWASDSFTVYNNPPPKPQLQPVQDTSNNSVWLNWTESKDPDGDPVYHNLKFDGRIEANVSPPVLKEGLSFGQHTWAVQACDPWVCSGWSEDSFHVINRPPSPPVLKDQGPTSSSQVVLEWTSGQDPEGDQTYDEYWFNGSLKSPASPPQIEKGLLDFWFYEWRVRTCDIHGACSPWVSDTFIKYVCVCPPCPPCRPSGDGGGVCPPCPKPCEENWVCEPWGPCLEPGIQFRECIDLNQCNTTCKKPPEWRRCQPPEKLEVKPAEVGWWMILLVLFGIFSLVLLTVMLYLVLKR
ncbi:MAG: hypothetical protein DRP12_03695 [Candidatus Aenigmatarchaeota archaeon]|nr:MAG: hypothetical protein DRP12_03695 [Candidatus Aenigmarchaeota archaeon]